MHTKWAYNHGPLLRDPLPRKRRVRKPKRVLWETASPIQAPPPSPSPYDGDAESETTRADSGADEAGSATAQQQQPMRSIGMNSYGGQPARQTPRLQNTNKTGLGGTSSGWGGFGMPSAAGGFGGLGGAPGLGQPRAQQLSGFAQVMGGGSGQGPIDMSDFPSLSGGPRPQQNNAAAPGWNSSAIRQPSAQPQQQQQPGQARAPSAAPSQQSLDQFDGQRTQQPPIERSGGGDDFPPLGGQLNGDGFGQTNGVSSIIGSSDAEQPRTNGQQAQLPIRQGSINFHQNQQTPATQPPPSQALQNGQPPAPSLNIKKYADMTENERWGLTGLLAAFQSRSQAEAGGNVDDTLPPALRHHIIMGNDLNSLGLDLDSNDPLYPTFTPFQAVGSSGSSFDFHERHMVPDFTLPSAYTVNNVPALQDRISAFSDETLFSVFYQNPRDALQELAATELISREWRWHKLLRQWLQKDTREASSSSSLQLVDLTNGAPVGTQPIRTSERGEKGVYVFFDAMNWRRERRVLELDYEHLDPARVATMPPGLGGVGAQGVQGQGQGRVQGVEMGGVGQGSSLVPGA
ncbi:transcriptional regulator [Saxophila tyrrhenica]|uniref:Transcriptional regulator n=1 Tax=Saxophila tyrrhenica TaxID=1690608 RepID=A0AAV9P524_9PEZI|nr:transcriptional regulator [Saxophila tyrrhenica]